MIVIADASPLNYLILIDEVDVLRQLYGRVVVPAGVARELTAGGSPSVVRTWAGAAPDWIEVRHVDVPAEAEKVAWDVIATGWEPSRPGTPDELRVDAWCSVTEVSDED